MRIIHKHNNKMRSKTIKKMNNIANDKEKIFF